MRRTVLIVDDDQGVIDTFARMLRLEGFDVLTALDADAGWSTMAAIRVDAILLDLRMPLVDGLGFLRRLRAQEYGHDIPVAVLTGDYFIDESLSRASNVTDWRRWWLPIARPCCGGRRSI